MPMPPPPLPPPLPPPTPDWLLLILAAFAWIWDDTNFNKVVKLATLFGGGIGLCFLYIRTRAADNTAWAALKQAETAADQAKIAAKRHEEQTTADRERRITESFAKAVEQLGSDKLETRLGGIYTLERIAGESEREYWPIMETLTAFVRERAPWPPGAQNTGEAPDESTTAEPPKGSPGRRPPICPETDIQAVLTVLGRRDKTAPKHYDQERAAARRLDLTATDLRGAYLSGARLDCAILQDAHLEHANLWEAHLRAELWGTHLKYASLWKAHLEGAILWDAHLESADLQDAHLQNAQLWRAHLDGASFMGAHLDGAKLAGAVGLRQYQLKEVSCDDRTSLPEGLHGPPVTGDDGNPDNAR